MSKGLTANFFVVKLAYRGKFFKTWQRVCLKSFITDLIRLENVCEELDNGQSFYHIEVIINNVRIFSANIREIEVDDLREIMAR